MVGETEADEESDDELLRQWEARIDEVGDPVETLAELLGERQAARRLLFSRAGDMVLDCRLERILGAGGMGVTYAGTAADGNIVAIKLMPRVEGDAIDRFEQECRVLASLRHPAIVGYRAHTVTKERLGVLVMDLVEGIDLQSVFDALTSYDPLGEHPVVQALLGEVDATNAPRWQSPRLRRRLLRLLADIAEGLHAAHERGVVHRDVKPTNIIVRPDLSPVLIDFGLAKDLLNRVSLTQSGIAMGTLAYMAPEQLGSDPGGIDRRTDVFALGLVLYRALCGEELRGHVSDVVRRAHQPFLLAAKQSGLLSVDLQAILYRCLDPRPAYRYPTALALSEDLRAAAGHGPVAAQRPSALARYVRNRRAVHWTLAAAALVILLAAYWQWPRGREVVFAANCDPATATLEVDGQTTVRSGGRLWLPFGEHWVRLIGDPHREVSTSFRVAPGPGADWVTLRTHDQDQTEFSIPGHATLQWQTGHGWLEMAPGVARDRRFIDGKLVIAPGPFTAEGILSPGRHNLYAVDGKGREERQTIEVGSAPEDVVMLPAVMADVAGSFRRTWCTVLSPRPAELALLGPFVTWMGLPRPSSLTGIGADEVSCALTAGAANQEVTVDLLCTFPEPMRTAVVYLRGLALSGGELEIRAGFDGSPLQTWSTLPSGTLQPRESFTSVSGSQTFRIEARMRVAEAPSSPLSLVRFLDGALFGGHWRDEPPCFAIVADPGQAARLPVSTVHTTLDSLPSYGLVHNIAEVVVHPPDTLGALTSLPGPDGSVDLLLQVRHPALAPVLQRRQWPSLAQKETIAADHLHVRRVASEALNFGRFVITTADLDGDGHGELVLGDDTSARRGPLNSGVVASLGSRDNGVRWLWPLTPVSSEYGDDEAGIVFATGDWNNDGIKDIVAGAQSASPGGVAKGGLVAILDARTGAVLQELHGHHARNKLRPLDSWTPADESPSAVLLREQHYLDPGDAPDRVGYGLWFQGPVGRRTGMLPQSYYSVALLVGPVRGSDPAVLVLNFGRWQGMGPGIRRYTLRDGELRLDAEEPIALPIFDDLPNDQRGPIWAARTGDLDGDGVLDAAFGFAIPALPNGVLFVSGKTARSLGFTRLGGRPGGDQGVWIPAVDSAPAQLLLVLDSGIGSTARSALIGIVPK